MAEIEIRGIETLEEMFFLEDGDMLPVVRQSEETVEDATVQVFKDLKATLAAVDAYIQKKTTTPLRELLQQKIDSTQTELQQKIDSTQTELQEKIDENHAAMLEVDERQTEKLLELLGTMDKNTQFFSEKIVALEQKLQTLSLLLANADTLLEAAALAGRVQGLEEAVRGRLYDFVPGEDGVTLDIKRYIPEAEKEQAEKEQENLDNED